MGSREFYERHQLDCGWEEMHGFSKFGSRALMRRKQHAKVEENVFPAKGIAYVLVLTEGEKLKVLET